MSITKLANIFALSTLAVLLCSFAPSQTLAVAVQANHLARQVPNHHGIARKKRSKRDGQCKPRSSTSPPASTPAGQPTSTPADQPTNTPQSSPSPNNSPSPSSTQSPNPVATNTPSSNSGNKFCIAWALENDPRFSDITQLGRVFQVLLWDSHIPDLVKQSGLPASIMLWDDSGDKVAAFQQAVQQGGFVDVRGFNEVNEPTQANMDVPRAISAWRSNIAPLQGKGITITSPCTTSAPNGLTWVQDFFNQCPDCASSIDLVAVHWYDVKAADLITYLENWADTFGKPLALTEFACQNFNGGDQPSMDDVWSFATTAVAFFESYDKLQKFAPFGYMDDLYNVNYNNALFVSSGLTSLGSYYASH